MNTVSGKLAKQLKEAGFPQESYFYWHYTELWKDDNKRLETFNVPSDSKDWQGFAAPTAEEILEALDSFVTLSRGSHGYISTIPGLTMAQSAETIDFNASNCLAKLYLLKTDTNEDKTEV